MTLKVFIFFNVTILDRKYSENNKIDKLLKDNGFDSKFIANVEEIVKTVSFSKELEKKNTNLSFEQKIVQDADRLDAIGAIGIARVFIYAGAKNHVLYDSKLKPRTLTKENYIGEQTTAINHIHEKLLKLKCRMKTQSAVIIATRKHNSMINYLKDFYYEMGEKNV